VCIPAYRQVAYLRTTLDSLRRQQFQDYELIITDDSETGEVEALVSRYGFGERLTYHRNTARRGSPGNWNEAVRRARGEYIKLLHHDDWFPHTNCLGSFVRLLDRATHAMFGFCSSEVVAGNEDLVRIQQATEEELGVLERTPELLFMGNFIGSPSATIYRKSLNIEYDERLTWLVDVDFYIRALKVCRSFAHTADALIRTPTGVPHQVTERIRSERNVDLREHVLVFYKHYEVTSTLPNVVGYWRHLLVRRKIGSIAQLQEITAFPRALIPFFKSVFDVPAWPLFVPIARRLDYVSLANFSWRGFVLSLYRRVVVGTVIALYLRLPDPVKEAWRSVKRTIRRDKRR